MNRLRTSLVATLIIAILASVPTAASAQNGWAFFVPTQSGPGGGIYHTFVQGINGLEETFTDEFTPGTHTMARVEARFNNCTASADNVTFTVTAGKWTEVDVPMTWKSCSMPIVMSALGLPGGDGAGTVRYTSTASIGPSQLIATCTLNEASSGPPFYTWSNFHACQGDAPYGASIQVTLSPTAGSTASVSDYVIAADTNSLNFTSGGSFSQFPHPFPSGVSAKTDLSITLVGGSAQGFVSSSTFRIVNHGPTNATGVHVSAIVSEPEQGETQNLMSIQDGFCSFEVSCDLSMLPAGDSTTVTLRTETVPDLSGDAPTYPTEIATCSSVTVYSLDGPTESGAVDPNTANNHAACVTTTVPVTVALGGATPPSHTVAAGASDVPMIEFLLTPASQQTVTGVTVQASGTGNEQTDVTAVNLYVDKNGNGAIDAGDSLVATGTFAANDGSVTLAVNPGLAITAPTALLVTYSFSVTVAERVGGAIVLAFLPLFFIPAARKRKTLLAMLLVMLTSIAVVSCGGDSTGPKPGNGSVTFKSTLTGVTTTTGSVSNLAVSGATITINK